MDLIDVETELRRHLADRPVPRAPEGLADRTRSLHRRRRRHQAGVAGAVLATALVFGSIPALRGMLPEVGTAGDVAAPASTEPLPSLYDLPPRGSLSGDQEWLAAVAALPWTSTAADRDTDPPADSHRVTYAADVPGARVALVMGREGAALSAAWFVGPAGAAPTQMTQPTASVRAFPDQPMTLVDTPDPTGPAVLVVVSRPGDTVEYTQGRLVSAAGEETEDVVRLDLTDGAGFREVVPPGVYLGGEEVRVRRDGEQAYALNPTVSDRAADSAFDTTVAIADPRGVRTGLDEGWLQSEARFLVSRYGSGAQGATLELLAGGPVPGQGDPHMAMIGLTFPSGATTAVAVRYRNAGEGSSAASSALSPLPAGTPLLEQAMALRLEDSLAVSAPARAVSAEALAADGTVVSAFPVSGAAVVGLPLSPLVTQVRVLDAAGAVIAQVPATGTVG